ncbi:(2Fe-2S) ferredoxin domain-containing protein [Oxynema aestuarii]|jgi:(2Fe-2S) ferredoxin|uniref:(2Fe-2S) ferredoxin domain-containing protein n=1 Tax=Oxynema aestuarii AP17 TaxID=2064643 RepID=A0A6H1U076_9CYAN|nr:(2Fe-2S) ferredoxin domain-containing protein [Oxynema aestuarii]QIZ71423.1 (2Fe-2S) ferredoxin domain-containing protein [Oxynema aestuarii AP17]RMH77052.1 MAG: (2Fe-2S) ferredoxin domain-containing protein [Cyanobacteria bacterium J007]
MFMDKQPPKSPKYRAISICQHDSCRRNGSAAVLKAFETADLPEGVTVNPSGCLGQCSCGPTVKVNPDNVWYCRIKPEQIERIVTEHLQGEEPVEEWLNPRMHMRFSI